MYRSTVKFALDLGIWLLAVPLAYVIRLDTAALPHAGDIAVYALAGLPIKAIGLALSRAEMTSWHRVGLRDLGPLAVTVLAVFLAEVVLVFVLRAPLGFVPRSVPVIESMVALLGLGGLRFAARLYFEERGVLRVRLRGNTGVRKVLIAGAGEAGVMLARELQRHPESGRRPVGFVDDDPAKQRRSFMGVRVVGPISELARVAARLDVDEVLVAMPSASGGVLRTIVQQARHADIEHRTIPALHALVNGTITVSSLREVAVEDLLRRDPVTLDVDPIRAYLSGRRVLVTGAGGSIGSEIARQVAAFGPAELLLLGRGENSVFGIDRQLAKTAPDIPRRALICDVRDERSLRAVFESTRPEIVFHAAAHKHVPLMEANPEQAVLNNVGGTRNLVELATEYGVERLVNVSTDKAVNPTSIMGASKRVAENVVAEGAQRCGPGQVMVSVRFGNVLGSRGSVVPIFREQIASGGPVTVTHPEMTRYFMTIPEASQLVLQAGAMAENGRVYVLDMGEPVRIVDLARDLILLSGLEPERDVEIEFSGVRPGEKLFEEMLTAEEGTDASSHQKIFVARKSGSGDRFAEGLEALFEAAASGDDRAIRAAFHVLVPTYTRPAEDAVESETTVGGSTGDGHAILNEAGVQA